MADLTRRRLFGKNGDSVASSPLPWLRNPAQFADDCSRCGACLSACETNIITKGDGGFPRLDFSLGECSFCYQCAAACPEPLFISQAHQAWTANASIAASCLAHTNVDCRSCQDSCDDMAITFELAVGRVAQPKISTEHCTGCGACVSVCPVNAVTIHHQPREVDVLK